MENSPKNTKLLVAKTCIVLFITIVLFAGVYYVTVNAKHIAKQNTSHKLQFLASQQGRNAIKIFPGPLSQQAKAFLSGFSLQELSLSDGTEQVTLLAKKQDFTSQVLIVKPGDSVYFTDQHVSDDSAGADDDVNLHDDKAIVVDKNGQTVSQ